MVFSLEPSAMVNTLLYWWLHGDVTRCAHMYRPCGHGWLGGWWNHERSESKDLSACKYVSGRISSVFHHIRQQQTDDSLIPNVASKRNWRQVELHNNIPLRNIPQQPGLHIPCWILRMHIVVALMPSSWVVSTFGFDFHSCGRTFSLLAGWLTLGTGWKLQILLILY